MFSIFSIEGGVASVDGFFCDGVSIGLKPNQELDFGFIYSENLADVEALFTTNRFQAAPIKHFQNYPKDFKTNFLLLNSKNANAMTNREGVEDIEKILKEAKVKFPNIKNPIMSSTGVIGYRLPTKKMIEALSQFDLNSKNSDSLAKSIMTTDSFKKEIALEVKLDDSKESFKIGAVAKGAGMINPQMATMLCFIVTDSDIPKSDMRELLSEINEESFNSISVDGDTSTNDTVMLFTNRKSKEYNKLAFKEALRVIMQKLSFDILKDGEGSNKVVAFEVKGAKTKEDAIKASKALSNSLLVKTALFGEDPNWGRIASTIGSSEVECSEESLIIKYDNLEIYSKDKRVLDSESEKLAHKIMQKSEYRISCDLGVGEESFTSFGCDLSYDYIKINAEYRT